ncbi:MAG TPA: FHA domain-containing protein [Gaiellaceae bacterium]|nr:FHA domain-containing protein [Gaiellaceae bacterium]
MIVASTALEEVLLALKIAFLVLLYAFIWQIVRTAGRGLQAAQQSIILRPPLAGVAVAPTRRARLVVLASPILDPGAEFEVDRVDVTIGRGDQNDIAVEGDAFASARHVRIEPLPDGVWVQDLGSTNGTFVNGVRIEQRRRLDPGDVVRIGGTDLRFEI